VQAQEVAKIIHDAANEVFDEIGFTIAFRIGAIIDVRRCMSCILFEVTD
jgi:hypothetical protein